MAQFSRPKMAQFKKTVDNYRSLARETNIIGRIQANMLMVRMNVKDFQITGSEQDKKQFEEYIVKLTGFIIVN